MDMNLEITHHGRKLCTCILGEFGEKMQDPECPWGEHED
jgi:hypothetical protein